MIPFDALLDPLRQRLARPLPGFDAQAEMAPFGRHAEPEVISIDGKEARLAATLVLLYPMVSGGPAQGDPRGAPTGTLMGAASGGGGAPEAAFVLTVRQPTLRAHSGQVSLPGGSLDGAETPEAAALREGWEEIGVPPGEPEVLGRLSPLYIPPSGFAVWPVVAALGHRPAFAPQEEEVAALLEVPLAALLASGVRQRTTRTAREGTLHGVRFEVPFFALAGQEVWGATAMMLAEFAAVVVDALAD